MMRTAISILLLALGAAPALAQSGPRLKAQAIVASDVVRIGDLVENAGVAANTPIFRAPDLGQTGAVPARAVIDAVRPYGLIGSAHGGTPVTVRKLACRALGDRRGASLRTDRHRYARFERSRGDARQPHDRDRRHRTARIDGDQSVG